MLVTSIFFLFPSHFLSCLTQSDHLRYLSSAKTFNKANFKILCNGKAFNPLQKKPFFSPRLIDQLIVWCLTLFSTVFQLYRSGQCTYPCFHGVISISTLHNIPFKPLAAFPQNQCRNNGQR